MNIPKVKNMTSTRSNREVANQFLIYVDDGVYFQSYQTIIAFWPNGKSKVVLDQDSWDYSRTTLKYLKEFLRTVSSKKDIEKSIKLGDFVLENLN